MLAPRSRKILERIDKIVASADRMIDLVDKLYQEFEVVLMDEHGVKVGDVVQNRHGTFVVRGIDEFCAKVEYRGEQPALRGRNHGSSEGGPDRTVLPPWKVIY